MVQKFFTNHNSRLTNKRSTAGFRIIGEGQILQKIIMCHGVKLKNERSTAGFRIMHEGRVGGPNWIYDTCLCNSIPARSATNYPPPTARPELV